ncbi:MAG: cell division ATP-binding protein FtsE [Gammaproteobacteria bacterium]|nr:cell division ATP-binding protein FtsE [Gammaproteobacteria bacterium]MBT5333062.1 cell division ATP-binding protein FtsE [Gammaproteobacteria bacterium]MBT5681943.1 cell division ATP-binding protein FtsE [Gammaproteobacteria bacterium]MBT6026268.1 cell division ATP-binding protein FtsE [Gammaproteobacteria bacterium]MBT6557042.1 cell division ATP-binding protein FtsE [Gammaproteobacteria bacterium]
MASIVLENVTKQFSSGYKALADVSVEFASGSMTFLTGHSGAGKSTFLRLLIGADEPTRGRVLVGGVNINQLSAKRMPWYRRNVGVVFQDHHLLADRSVFENVALPLRIGHFPAKEIAPRVRGALSAVDLLDKEKLLPGFLSTGEQQRVGIARAVVNRPKILLADEPTGNLDPDLSQTIMDLFGQFREIGTTVIIATHDIELVKNMGQPTLKLVAGCLEDPVAAQTKVTEFNL